MLIFVLSTNTNNMSKQETKFVDLSRELVKLGCGGYPTPLRLEAIEPHVYNHAVVLEAKRELDKMLQDDLDNDLDDDSAHTVTLRYEYECRLAEVLLTMLGVAPGDADYDKFVDCIVRGLFFDID